MCLTWLSGAWMSPDVRRDFQINKKAVMSATSGRALVVIGTICCVFRCIVSFSLACFRLCVAQIFFFIIVKFFAVWMFMQWICLVTYRTGSWHACRRVPHRRLNKVQWSQVKKVSVLKDLKELQYGESKRWDSTTSSSPQSQSVSAAVPVVAPCSAGQGLWEVS